MSHHTSDHLCTCGHVEKMHAGGSRSDTPQPCSTKDCPCTKVQRDHAAGSAKPPGVMTRHYPPGNDHGIAAGADKQVRPRAVPQQRR